MVYEGTADIFVPYIDLTKLCSIRCAMRCHVVSCMLHDGAVIQVCDSRIDRAGGVIKFLHGFK